ARTSVSGPVPSGVWGRAIDAAAAFISLQRTESLFWIVIRGVVFLAAAVQIIRRTASDTVLIALITAFLWLAAYPSSIFMHQWWTASSALASFVACIPGALGLLLRQRRVVAGFLTVAVAGIVASYDISLRADQAVWRARALTETVQQPPL